MLSLIRDHIFDRWPIRARRCAPTVFRVDERRATSDGVKARATGGLRGATVLAFQSRRAAELERMIRRHGGEPVVAPSVREVPLSENPVALDFLADLERGGTDIVVLLTGVGLRALADLGRDVHPPGRLIELLRDTTLVARGPKPTAELRRLALAPQVRVAEPYTWREVLAALDAEVPLAGARLAVLEHGAPDHELVAAIEARGAAVTAVPLYRWALPTDQAPLRDGVARLARGAAAVALFTSGAQVEHVMQVAGEMGLRDSVLAAARQLVVASVGPVCSTALRRHGLPVHLEPDHPKVGHLLVALGRYIGELERPLRQPSLLATGTGT